MARKNGAHEMRLQARRRKEEEQRQIMQERFTLEELRTKAYQAWEDHKTDVVNDPEYRAAAEKHGPVCKNCGQWQRTGRNGYLDCLNDCVQRGFAPKNVLKNEKGSAGIVKLVVLGVWVAVWLILAGNFMTPSVASDLAAHKAQIENMLEVK